VVPTLDRPADRHELNIQNCSKSFINEGEGTATGGHECVSINADTRDETENVLLSRAVQTSVDNDNNTMMQNGETSDVVMSWIWDDLKKSSEE